MKILFFKGMVGLSLSILLCCFWGNSALAQLNSDGNFSLYGFKENGNPFLVSPDLIYFHTANKNSIFLEARYNYDNTNTLGLYGGYRFILLDKENAYLECIPQVGWLTIGMQAISPGINLYFEGKKYEAYSQFFSPISISDEPGNNFSFEWFEGLRKFESGSVVYKIGPSVQLNLQNGGNRYSYGLKGALEWKRLEWFLYGFSSNISPNPYSLIFGIMVNRY